MCKCLSNQNITIYMFRDTRCYSTKKEVTNKLELSIWKILNNSECSKRRNRLFIILLIEQEANYCKLPGRYYFSGREILKNTRTLDKYVHLNIPCF